MERISIKRALSEIKNINSKLEILIEEAEFITVARKTSNKTKYISKNEFSIRANKSFSTIQSLIKRKELLKASIIASNATTKIQICEKEMTVAEAIDMKKISLNYRRRLLGYLEYCLKFNYQCEILKLIDNRAEASKLGYRLYGKDESNKDKVEAFAKDYMANHPIITIDPLNLEEKVNAEKAFIKEFEENIDNVLYISSCTTFINI